MATSNQVETALLTEHLGWTPISFIDEVINTVNELLARATDSIESGLLAADAGRDLGFSAKAAAQNQILDTETDENGEQREVWSEDARKEIEEGVCKLESLLENTVDKNFDKWEIWVLRNVLALGKNWEGHNAGWIRLKGYEDLVLPTAHSPNDAPPITPENLMALRRKLQETQKLHNLLLAERARNATVIAQLRALLQPHPNTVSKRESSSPSQKPAAQTGPDFSFLQQAASGNLSNKASFPLTQLPLLRQHLESLKPYCSSRPPQNAGAKTETGLRALERKDYIESQTKRVLERRGVDVGEGVGGGLGGRRTAEEVKALEQVVDLLAKDSTPANGDQMDVDG